MQDVPRSQYFLSIKKKWMGEKGILSLDRQKQVKPFFRETMTWLGGNGVSTVRKAPWCLCHRLILQMMPEKTEWGKRQEGKQSVEEEGLGSPKQDLKSGVLGACRLFDSKLQNTCIAVFLQELLFLYLWLFLGGMSADIKNWRAGEAEFDIVVETVWMLVQRHHPRCTGSFCVLWGSSLQTTLI